jgi:hypothetical protein
LDLLIDFGSRKKKAKIRKSKIEGCCFGAAAFLIRVGQNAAQAALCPKMLI